MTYYDNGFARAQAAYEAQTPYDGPENNYCQWKIEFNTHLKTVPGLEYIKMELVGSDDNGDIYFGMVDGGGPIEDEQPVYEEIMDILKAIEDVDIESDRYEESYEEYEPDWDD